MTTSLSSHLQLCSQPHHHYTIQNHHITVTTSLSPSSPFHHYHHNLLHDYYQIHHIPCYPRWWWRRWSFISKWSTFHHIWQIFHNIPKVMMVEVTEYDDVITCDHSYDKRSVPILSLSSSPSSQASLLLFWCVNTIHFPSFQMLHF